MCMLLQFNPSTLLWENNYEAMLQPEQFNCLFNSLFWLTTKKPSTKREMSSFRRNFHNWPHKKLSKRQVLLKAITIMSSKWRHIQFSVNTLRCWFLWSESINDRWISHAIIQWWGFILCLKSSSDQLWVHINHFGNCNGIPWCFAWLPHCQLGFNTSRVCAPPETPVKNTITNAGGCLNGASTNTM